MEIRYYKKHNHEDRQKFVDEITVLLQKKFKDNLVSFAVAGSFATNKDVDYSDLEFIVFLKKKPKNLDEIHLLVDDMKIELPFFEYSAFKKQYMEVNDSWPHYGAEKLLPIINEKFIKHLNEYSPRNIDKRCISLAKKNFESETYEYFGKLFNAIIYKQTKFLPFIAIKSFESSLVTLAYLNKTAFPSYNQMVKISQDFTLKPKAFDEFLGIIEGSNFKKYDKFLEVATRFHNELVQIFDDQKIRLFDKTKLKNIL